jgi:SAM-dependent methyltransferase
MSAEATYTDDFHDMMGEAALASARHVVPHVLSFVRPVASIVDVGCGLGAWLSVFAERGVERIVGLDGASVDHTRLMIPADRFQAVDLAAPLPVEERFDLAISLEVAEHLPAARAEGFVDDLVRLAPIVLFSAAVPGQRGVGHVHERWPRYWSGLFNARGYLAIDGLRPLIWLNPQVSWWYRQNLLMFATADAIDARPALARARARTHDSLLSIVHPTMHEAMYREYVRLAARLAEIEQAPREKSG